MLLAKGKTTRERMEYLPEQGKVLYRSGAQNPEACDTLERLAARVSRLPLKGVQLVKCCGHTTRHPVRLAD